MESFVRTLVSSSLMALALSCAGRTTSISWETYITDYSLLHICFAEAKKLFSK